MRLRSVVAVAVRVSVLLVCWCGAAAAQSWNVDFYDIRINDPAGIFDRTRAESVAFMPDGKIVVTAGYCYRGATKDGWGEVQLRRADNGVLVATLVGQCSSYAGRAGMLAVAPSGTLIAAGGFTKEHTRIVDIFDPTAGKLVRTLKGHANVLRCVAFSPDGKLLATAYLDGTVELWDTQEWGLISRFSAQIGIWPISFSPDGDMLAIGNDNGSISFWDPTTGKGFGDIQAQADLASIGAIAFSPDGKFLAAAGSPTNAGNSPIYVWELIAASEDGNQIRAKQKAKMEGHRGHTYSLAFSPEGTLLACANQDATATIWNVQDGTLRARITQHSDFVYDVEFAPDGKTLVTLSRDSMKSWNVAQLTKDQ